MMKEVKHTCSEASLERAEDNVILVAEDRGSGLLGLPPEARGGGSSTKKATTAHRSNLHHSIAGSDNGGSLGASGVAGIFHMDRLSHNRSKDKPQFERMIDSPSPDHLKEPAINFQPSRKPLGSIIPVALVTSPPGIYENEYQDSSGYFLNTLSNIEGLRCKETGPDCGRSFPHNTKGTDGKLFKVPSATSQTPLMMAAEVGTPPTGSLVNFPMASSDTTTLEAAAKVLNNPKNDDSLPTEGQPLLARSKTTSCQVGLGASSSGGDKSSSYASDVRKISNATSLRHYQEECQGIQVVVAGVSRSGSLKHNGSNECKSCTSSDCQTKGHTQKEHLSNDSNGFDHFGCTWSSMCGRNPKKITTIIAAFTSVWVLYVLMLHFKKQIDSIDSRATVLAREVAEIKASYAVDIQRLTKEVKELSTKLQRRPHPHVKKNTKGTDDSDVSGSKPSVGPGSSKKAPSKTTLADPKPFDVPTVTKCETETGASCIFPFYYKGTKYTTCVTVWNYRRPWCAVKVDKYQALPALDTSSWDYCQTTCPSTVS